MDQERLQKIFKKSSKNGDCIATQEGYTVEYKQSFGWGNIGDYARAMAAMANNRGGHIIFGIKDKPHELMGIDEKVIKKFNDKDLSKWSEALREFFEPNIIFEKDLIQYDDKIYGVIEVQESIDKPIICKKYVEHKLRIGAIYYRYKAENTEIQYAELRHIVDVEKQKVNELWMQRIKQIGLAGVSNTMILNTNTGSLEGNTKSIYISEDLLKEIRFVDRGKFVESDGEPVLSIVGEVKSVKDIPVAVSIREKEIALSDNRILDVFLQKENVTNGKEYISYILNVSAKNFPIFYYIHKMDLSKENAIKIISEIVGMQNSKKIILERVKKLSYTYYAELKNTGTDAYKKKIFFKNQLLNDCFKEEKDFSDYKYMFVAIRSLSKEEIEEKTENLYLIMKTIYYECFQIADTNFRAEFKRALCYMDEVIYKNW